VPPSRPNLRLVDEETKAELPVAEVLDLDEAFRRYAPYVAAVGLRLLGRPDEVDDLVQDVFIEAHKGLHRLRDPGALKGWLATVAVRLARRRLDRRRRWRWLGTDERIDSAALPAPGATPEQQALLRAVFQVLDDLPPNLRIAWALRYLQQERLDSVARLCGCSLATAKRRISAAHAAIREAMDHG